MTQQDPWLDPRFHFPDRGAMDQAAQARDAAAWLGGDYVTGQLRDADRYGGPGGRADAVADMQQEAFALMGGPSGTGPEETVDAVLLLLLS